MRTAHADAASASAPAQTPRCGSLRVHIGMQRHVTATAPRPSRACLNASGCVWVRVCILLAPPPPQPQLAMGRSENMLGSKAKRVDIVSGDPNAEVGPSAAQRLRDAQQQMVLDRHASYRPDGSVMLQVRAHGVSAAAGIAWQRLRCLTPSCALSTVPDRPSEWADTAQPEGAA